MGASLVLSRRIIMPIGIFNGNSRHMQYMRELQEEAAMAEREKQLEALHDEDRAAYQELIALDPDGGEAWYDDDNNIPALGSTRERIKLVRARINDLKAERGMQ